MAQVGLIAYATVMTIGVFTIFGLMVDMFRTPLWKRTTGEKVFEGLVLLVILAMATFVSVLCWWLALSYPGP